MNEDLVSLIKEIGGLLVIAGGFIGTIIGGINLILSSRAKEKIRLAEQANKMAEEERKRLELAHRKEENEVALTEKLQQVSSALVSSMEERFVKLEARLRDTEELVEKERKNHKLQIEELKREVKTANEKYEAERRRSALLRETGLRLMEGIQESLRVREENPHSDNCAACLMQDRTLLAKLQEVRELFEREESNRKEQNGS